MRIFIANLPYDATDEQLRALFVDFGQVKSAKHLFDKETQRPRGIGFVEMLDDDKAEEAIHELNGSDFLGRPIRVEQARERQQPDLGRPQHGRGGMR